MRNTEEDAAEDTDFHQHLSEVHLTRSTTKICGNGLNGNQRPSGFCRGTDLIGYTLRKLAYNVTPSSDLKPAGEKKEGPAPQQLEMGH